MSRHSKFPNLSVTLGAAACAVTVLVHDGMAQCQINELTELSAPDASSLDWFGEHVAIDGDVALIGAKRVNVSGIAGAVYVYRHDGNTWTYETTLMASDAAPGDEFSQSVSVSGDVAVIGALRDDDACPGDPDCNSGSAYVFRFDGSHWIEEAKLTAYDGAADDGFGVAVSVSGDVIIVGAYQDGNTGPSAFDGHGAAYIYRYNSADGTWANEQKIIPSDAAVSDLFGFGVAIDGDTALISKHGDDTRGGNAGAVYVYGFDGETWDQEQKLFGSDTATSDQFGKYLAMEGDRAIFGAMFDADAGRASGSAYVFSRGADGWEQEAKLRAADAAAGDSFGISVDVSGDVAVVGAYGDDTYAGSGYVFLLGDAGWRQEAKLTAAERSSRDFFGWSVGIDSDTAVLGGWRDDDACPSDPDCNSGSAYMFVGLSDCNDKGALDACDIAFGTSEDANGDGRPDECGCRADFNGDGAVNTLDFLDYLNAFNAGDPAADFDENGQVNTRDFIAFLNAFSEGCA